MTSDKLHYNAMLHNLLPELLFLTAQQTSTTEEKPWLNKNIRNILGPFCFMLV